MCNRPIFILQDEDSFVKDFDIEQQQLMMTQDVTEAVCLCLKDALEVVRLLGWLASKRLVVKPFQGIFSPG